MPVSRTCRALLISGILLPGVVATAVLQTKVKQPTLPYIDQGACPGEYCVYGSSWMARKSAPVYDTWQSQRRRIGQIAAGERVTAPTGLVITTKPGTIRMDRDLPEQGLKRGDIILTYTYRGEGFSAVWFGGTFYPDFDISFSKWPDGSGCGGTQCAATYTNLGDKVWWAQVQLRSGATGWINMTGADFDMGKN